MLFDNLSRFAGVSEHVTLEVSEASRRAAGEVLIPRFVREKGLALSLMSLTFRRLRIICHSKTCCHPEAAFFAAEGPRECINISRQIKRQLGDARFCRQSHTP
jgi:hypothetical protein